jgi:hypothetical protein
MSFANYWAKKLRANNWLKGKLPFRIQPEAFKKELQKAYDQGYTEGMKTMKKLADLSGKGGDIDALRKTLGDG